MSGAAAAAAAFGCCSVLVALCGIAFSSCQIYFGNAALDDCPVEPMVPMWLLGE